MRLKFYTIICIILSFSYLTCEDIEVKPFNEISSVKSRYTNWLTDYWFIEKYDTVRDDIIEYTRTDTQFFSFSLEYKIPKDVDELLDYIQANVKINNYSIRLEKSKKKGKFDFQTSRNFILIPIDDTFDNDYWIFSIGKNILLDSEGFTFIHSESPALLSIFSDEYYYIEGLIDEKYNYNMFGFYIMSDPLKIALLTDEVPWGTKIWKQGGSSKFGGAFFANAFMGFSFGSISKSAKDMLKEALNNNSLNFKQRGSVIQLGSVLDVSYEFFFTGSIGFRKYGISAGIQTRLQDFGFKSLLKKEIKYPDNNDDIYYVYNKGANQIFFAPYLKLCYIF